MWEARHPPPLAQGPSREVRPVPGAEGNRRGRPLASLPSAHRCLPRATPPPGAAVDLGRLPKRGVPLGRASPETAAPRNLLV